MTTIQDRIIEKFREQFDRFPDDYYNGIVGKDGSRFSNTLSGLEELEEFILTSIKLVQEETRKEDKKKIKNYFGCISNSKKPINISIRELLLVSSIKYDLLKLLSITNKENQK